jgi:hypothetical protein
LPGIWSSARRSCKRCWPSAARVGVGLGKAPKAGAKSRLEFDVRQALANWAGVDLTRINGLGVTVVMKLLSEIGPDLSRFGSVKRMRAKLLAVKEQLRRRMHQTIAEQGKYLRSVVNGHMRYFGVPRNGQSLARFRALVARVWYRESRLRWQQMNRLVAHWLPCTHICHPYPNQRLIVTTHAWRTATALALANAFGTLLGNALAPQADRLHRYTQFLRNDRIRVALVGPQRYSRAHHISLRSHLPLDQR